MDLDPILTKLSTDDQTKLKEFLEALSDEQSHHNLDLTKFGSTTGSKSNVLTLKLEHNAQPK